MSEQRKQGRGRPNKRRKRNRHSGADATTHRRPGSVPTSTLEAVEVVVIEDDDSDEVQETRTTRSASSAVHQEQQGGRRKWQLKRRPPDRPRSTAPSPSSSSLIAPMPSSSSSATSSTAPTAPKEIRGYYYDPRLNRYFKKDPFRPQPAHTLPAASTTTTPTAPAPAPARRFPMSQLLHRQQAGLLSPAAFRRTEVLTLAAHWREGETEREGPAFVPTEVEDIALNDDGLFLMGHKGGAVTLDACCMKRDKEDLSLAFYSSHRRQVFALPISSLRWAPQPSSSGQPPLFAIGLFGGYNLPGSVDVRGVDFQSRTSISLNKGSLWCSEWKPQATHIALGVSQGALLFDVTTSRVTTMWTKKSDVFAQCFDSVGNVLFNASRDGMVRAFDLRAHPREARDGSHQPILAQGSPVCCVKTLTDDNYLVASSYNGKLQRWDRRMVRPVVAYEGHVNQYTHLSFALVQDYSLLVSGGQDKFLRVWDLHSGQLLQQKRPFTPHVIKNVAFGDQWKLVRGEEVSRTFMPALILPSLDWFAWTP